MKAKHSRFDGSSAPRYGVRRAFPWVTLGAFLVALAACSVSSKRDDATSSKPAPDVNGSPGFLAPSKAGSESPKTPEATVASAEAPPTERPIDSAPQPELKTTTATDGKTPAKGDEGTSLFVGAEPGYPKVVETPGSEEPPPGEAPRTVVLPPEIAVSNGPRVTLPERVLVSVVSLRGGCLARRPDLLRALARAIGKDESFRAVVSLSRLDAAAKTPADLSDLGRVAVAQGATLLLVESRPDDQTDVEVALVVHPASLAILAFSRGSDKSADPASKLAALLKSAR